MNTTISNTGQPVTIPESDGLVANNAPPTGGASNELQKGEKGFTIILLLVSLFFFYQSVLLYRENPGISSCAALPLGVSGFLVVLVLWNVLLNIKKKTPLKEITSLAERARSALGYIFAKDIVVMIGIIVLYSIALLLGLGFYIATPLFLWGSMCYLLRKDYIKNLLWMAICMLFIFLVFTLAFSVVLP